MDSGRDERTSHCGREAMSDVENERDRLEFDRDHLGDVGSREEFNSEETL